MEKFGSWKSWNFQLQAVVVVTLSSDAKWNNHIENIILGVSRHLGILRKLKYRLSRQNLEKLLSIYPPNF